MTSVHAHQYSVRQWATSYYFPEGKKWLSSRWMQGTLLVDYKGVTFCQQPAKNRREGVVRTLPFSVITSVRKATSSLIYSALAISVNNEVHWFSALPNRDAAFVVIEHFWRERLLSAATPGGQGAGGGAGRSRLGAELLRLTSDSEQTLQTAGNQLQRQGEQLQQAAATMVDLHQDLHVAEKFISGFESWVGHWRLPRATYANEPIEIIDSRAVPIVFDFPVLYAPWSDGAGAALKSGTLRISRDGLTIMNEDMCNVHHYSRRGVSAIRVCSPWEMTVSKYLIGQPDESYLLLSTHMVAVLQALEPLYRDRMDLVDPPVGIQPASPALTPYSSSTNQIDDGHVPPQMCPLGISTELMVGPRVPANPGVGGAQVQAQSVPDEVVTEEEAAELRDAVARMKGMAAEVSKEQAAQLETIDALTDNVDHTTHRLKADIRRIKQL